MKIDHSIFIAGTKLAFKKARLSAGSDGKDITKRISFYVAFYPTHKLGRALATFEFIRRRRI